MTKIKLIRSGGVAGKILTAETETDLNEDDLRKIAYAAKPIKDKLLRDSIMHTIVINDKEDIPVDIEELKKSKLKTIIEEQLEKKLKGK